MPEVIFEGKDLAEAIAKAGEALNLPPEQVKFSLISMGTRGFLGIGRRKAKIKINPDNPSIALDDEPSIGRKKAEKDSGKKPSRQRDTKGPSRRPEEAGPNKNRTKQAEEKYPKRPKNEGNHADQPESKDLAPLDFSHIAAPMTKAGHGETLVESPKDDEAADLALATVRRFLEAMGMDGETKVSRISSRLIITIDGPDNAILIGTRGATLESMQLLAGKIMTRALKDKGLEPVRLFLDVADYRARRQTAILESLKTAAEQARKSRKPQPVSGLNSTERRMIQLALRPFKDLLALPDKHREVLLISSKEAAKKRR